MEVNRPVANAKPNDAFESVKEKTAGLEKVAEDKKQVEANFDFDFANAGDQTEKEKDK
jgi:hypothetical protein